MWPFSKVDRTVKCLYRIVETIYLQNFQEQNYTISGFKAALCTYFGFYERTINTKFNYLVQMGILNVVSKRTKTNPDGKVCFDPDRFIELSNSKPVKEAWARKKLALQMKADDAQKDLDRIQKEKNIKEVEDIAKGKASEGGLRSEAD